MRYLFFVQGEGRGHMTQAIALSRILRENGHEVAAVLIGKSPRRQIPEFVEQKMGAPIVPFESPNFITDEKTKSLKIGPTLAYNLWHNKRFFKSIAFLNEQYKKHQPDVLVNFYDLLAGMFFKFYANDAKKVCVGHQYLVNHSDFEYPKGKRNDVFALRLNTKISAWKSDKNLALSFRPLPDEKGIAIVPPLLRKAVLDTKTEDQGYILAYLNNNGFSTEIIDWQKKHPEQEVHCFWDKKDADEEWSPQANLTFHRLNDEKFLEKMRGCKAYCSTSGFESICEAMYMGKPVLMVPIHKHIEQECNAIDAKKSGAGISSDFFDLDALRQYLPQHRNTQNEQFRHWAKQAEAVFLEELTNFASE